MLFGQYLQMISRGYDINIRNPKPEPDDLMKGLVVTLSRRLNFATVRDLAELISRVSNTGSPITVPVAKSMIYTYDVFYSDPDLADMEMPTLEDDPQPVGMSTAQFRTSRREPR